MESNNPIVANALAANAGVKSGNFSVVLETVDFSGNRTQSKNMTADQLKAWLRLVHQDGSDAFVRSVSESRSGEVQFNIDMHPTVTIKAI